MRDDTLIEPNQNKLRKMKTQIKQIRAVYSLPGSRFLHADSDNSYQTERMPRLIRVFVGVHAVFALVMAYLYVLINFNACIRYGIDSGCIQVYLICSAKV